jgi:DUF3096 family protein
VGEVNEARLPNRRFANVRGRTDHVSTSAYDAVVVLTPPECSREVSMNLHLTIGPIVSLIAGILILVVPRMLNYIVAIYLIIMGLLGLFGGGGSFHLR